MAFKDKDRQREASKGRMRRYRERKGVTHKAKTVTPNVTDVTPSVTPEQDGKAVDLVKVIPSYGQPDCACLHCRANRKTGNKFTINHGPHKTAAQLGSNEINRVSIPSDPDYMGTAINADGIV